MAHEEDPSSHIGSARRYYLAKRHVAEDNSDDLADSWRGKQEAEPGTLLPAGFPFLTELEEAGYTCVEDLDGASVSELQKRGFSQGDSEDIVAAFAAL